MLEAKLEELLPQIVIFTFKETAKRLFGNFAGTASGQGSRSLEARYVMPGPYEAGRTVSRTLSDLAKYVR